MAFEKELRTDTIEFKVPPAANVFYPNEEDFKDPLEYISKIRSTAEKTGICKIVPPKTWKNPFSLDVDKFKFSARIQKLNLLDGKTRMKLNFLDQIIQFWELEGLPLIIPEIENRQLDLYDLYRLTREQHLKKVTKIKWKDVTEHMGFDPKESIIAVVKRSFDEILHPFITFSQLCEIKTENVNFKSDVVYEIEESDGDNNDDDDDVCIIEDNEDKSPPNKDNTVKPHVNRELKRLRFLGPGPKMDDRVTSKRKRHNKVIKNNYIEILEYTCCGCGTGGDKSSILTCSNCKDEYHFSCIKPSLPSLPKRKWNCFKCVTLAISKPSNDFGFEQAREECTLFEFGEMADKFKSDYFKVASHLVSTETVEKEYWNIASNTDSNVIVRYGADLHTLDNGSGFPTGACANLQSADAEYVQCGWNLNNLPVLKNSLLRYINSDVSGMKVPWMYVGMCFATFCWHNEDHWLCSINYVHWGEPKTWYGVPGKDAELFENAMKAELPELFESQPDILHQLVTTVNPNILMKSNVPIYKLDQNEGEFVITFPRAYHMGFNQGFNFAEAVNFAPVDWFNIGRESILNYAQVKRFCVFSHDELLFSIASSTEKLNPTLASLVYSDMLYIIKKEEKLRKVLLDNGIVNTQRAELELLADDKRHCETCKTTCYVSALTCSCNDEIVVCLDHYNDLCKCKKSKQVLRYRYTLDEIRLFLANIDSTLSRYNTWLEKAENSLNQNCTVTITDVENLIKEAETENYPDHQLRTALELAVVNKEPLIPS